MNMAIGLIETKGLVSAIEALDASLKAANVQLVRKENSTGGWVTIFISGDVGSVKAAVDAGSAAADRLGQLISSHVIPRLAMDVQQLIEQPTPKVNPTGLEENKTLIEDLEHYKVVEIGRAHV